MIIADSNGVILYVNSAFEQVTGYAFDEAVGKRPSLLKSGMHARDFYEQLWRTIRSGQSFRGTFINRRKDGNLFYEQKTITPILRDGRGGITHFLATGKDITNEMVIEDRLRHLTQYDAVTALPNRGHFLDRLEQLLDRTESQGQSTAVLVLNLDRFKLVNESLGHEAGDALLRAVAQRLKELVRPADLVARLQADSFAILLDGIHGLDDVAPVAEGLMDAFTKPFMVEGEELFITASLGVSLWPDDGDTPAVLLQYAEVAVNRAKRRGRARCEYYEPAMNAQAARRLVTETELRRALERRNSCCMTTSR